MPRQSLGIKTCAMRMELENLSGEYKKSSMYNEYDCQPKFKI